MKEKLKLFGDIVVVTVLVSTVIFFFISRFFDDQIPLPDLLKLRHAAKIFFSFGYFLFIPASFVSHFPKALRIILAILAVPICFAVSYVTLSFPERILNSGQLGDQNYHVSVASVDFETLTKYILYRCNTNDLECAIVFEEYGGVSIDNTDLIIDENRKEVLFFRHSWLVYIDSLPSRTYELSNAEWLGQNIYWLAFYSENPVEFIFYRCNDETDMDCEILPFHYSKDSFQDFKLIDLLADDVKETVSIFIEGELIYVYGSQPKCYVEGCSLVRK